MVKKIDDSYVGFDVKEMGMNNHGEYLRVPVKEPNKEKPKKVSEAVDHPEHYNKGIEVIDFIESWDFDFATGNIIKYIARHKIKDDPIDDLKKARWYIDLLITRYEKEEG